MRPSGLERDARHSQRPGAPLGRGPRQLATLALQADFAAHTGPQGAAVGDALRLLAVWAVRDAGQGLAFAGSPEGSPRR
jgi:hypothetical protein